MTQQPSLFRKKPVTIEAVQFTQEALDAYFFDEQPLPAGLKVVQSTTHPPTRRVFSYKAGIETLEGFMEARIGDWIITGVQGERYPCKPDIFAATYEPADTPPASAQPERDWELSCDHCNGSGHVFVERQVAERKSDVQEFKEDCEECEGRGFTIAFEDIPGIAEYVRKSRPVASAQDDAKDVDARWYAVGRDGAATLCTCEEDARETAAESAQLFPNCAPYTAVQLIPAPAAGDALDAKRYRWLRDQTETDGIAIVMKDKHFDESHTCAENIDKFIDAALAAQVPHKGEAA